MRSQTALWIAGSRTTPPLPTSFGPASNCGLISATSAARSAVSAKADGSTITHAQFDPSSAVNNTDETIQLATGHGLHTGDKILYHHGEGGSDVEGLTDGNPYYVRVLTGDKVELYDTQDHAKTATSAFRSSASS